MSRGSWSSQKVKIPKKSGPVSSRKPMQNCMEDMIESYRENAIESLLSSLVDFLQSCLLKASSRIPTVCGRKFWMLSRTSILWQLGRLLTLMEIERILLEELFRVMHTLFLMSGKFRITNLWNWRILMEVEVLSGTVTLLMILRWCQKGWCRSFNTKRRMMESFGWNSRILSTSSNLSISVLFSVRKSGRNFL